MRRLELWRSFQRIPLNEYGLLANLASEVMRHVRGFASNRGRPSHAGQCFA
jgi:hypothetical protein